MKPLGALLTLTLGTVVALGAAASPVAVGAPAAPAREITGFPPYILGAEAGAVLRADPELVPGNYPMWTNVLLTRRYGRSILAPLGGVNFIATVGLQFWQGRLAVIILKWPATAFDSGPAWRRAADALHQRLAGAYASELIKTHTAFSSSVWALDLADAHGNALSGWSNDRPLEITLVYLWSPYVRALESAPAPENGY